MKHIQSLDDLISRKAVEFADQMKQAAAMADKEEEIRIETEKQLAFIQKEAGVKLEGSPSCTPVASSSWRGPMRRLTTRNPHTQALLSAVPHPDPDVRMNFRLTGEVADPANLPGGCAFYPRCPGRIDRRQSHRRRARAGRSAGGARWR